MAGLAESYAEVKPETCADANRPPADPLSGVIGQAKALGAEAPWGGGCSCRFAVPSDFLGTVGSGQDPHRPAFPSQRVLQQSHPDKETRGRASLFKGARSL